MSEDLTINLNALLAPGEVERMSRAVHDDLSSGGAVLSAASKMSVTREWIAERLRKELNIDALEVVAHAWASAREIRECAKRTRADNGSTEFLPIGKHTISQEINPSLTLSLGPLAHKVLTLTIEVEAEFEAVELEISNGHIATIHGDKCTLGSRVKYKSAELYEKANWRTFDLPGRYAFKPPGIEIP